MTSDGTRRRCVGVVVVALVAAGCLEQSEPPPTSPSPTVSVADLGIRQPNNATSCRRVFPAIPVDRTHAQTFLPSGFVAAEASVFFGQESYPVNTGLLIVSAMRCTSSDWSLEGYVEAMVGIFVAPPTIDGTPVEGEHFYELGRVVPADQPYRATIEDVGWNLIGDRVDVMHEGTPAHSGSATIGDPNGTLFSASVAAAPAKDDFTGTLHLRWWHETARGRGFFEYVFAPDGFLGPGTCEARPGSIAARLMQGTRCSEALFMVGPPYDVEGRFEFSG